MNPALPERNEFLMAEECQHENLSVLTTNSVYGGAADLLRLRPHLPRKKEEFWKDQALRCLEMSQGK